MRYRFRFTKAERARRADLQSVLSNPALTPRERLAALQALEKLEDAARSRSARTDPPRPAVQPSDPPPIPERPCADCGKVGPHVSQHNHRLVCHECICRLGNIRGVLTRASATTENILPEPAAPAPIAPAWPVADVHSGPRCAECGLVICGHRRPEIIGGEPRPVHLIANQLLPRIADVAYWQSEVDADRARKAVAAADIDENCPQSQAIREIARRELKGETF